LDNSTIFALIGAAGTVCAIIFGYLGYQKGLRQDSYKEGSDDSELKADTQYIKRRIDDVLLEQKETNKSINALSERVTRLEESLKSAWKRIESIEKGVKKEE
jgi:peptidoglycan hydrolase CwlO-like protein